MHSGPIAEGEADEPTGVRYDSSRRPFKLTCYHEYEVMSMSLLYVIVCAVAGCRLQIILYVGRGVGTLNKNKLLTNACGTATRPSVRVCWYSCAKQPELGVGRVWQSAPL